MSLPRLTSIAGVREPAAWSIALLLAACRPVIQLGPDAERVPLLTGVPVAVLEAYDAVGTVECPKGSNYRKLQTNIRQCQNHLRNRAMELQGDLIVITSQALGPGDCGNCVVMFGTAYRRRR